MRLRRVRLAALLVAAGLLAPALPLHAVKPPRVAATAPAKPKAKPAHKAKPAKVAAKPKPHRVAVPKRPLPKKKAGPPPVRTGLHAAQTLAEPGLVVAAASPANSGSC